MFRRRPEMMRQHMEKFEGFDFGRGATGFGSPRGGGRDRFSKGNLQFVILKMLKEESRHGYQIIKDLEERFKGFMRRALVQFIPYYKC